MARITWLIVALMVVVCLSAPTLAEDRQPVKTEQVAEGITRLIYADGSEAFDIPARGEEKRVMEFVPTPAQDRNEPNPSKDDSRRGYILFSPESRDGVLPEYIPSVLEVAGKVSIFASPGEYEPATFAVRALKDLGTVNFSCSDFVSSNGMNISVSNVDVYIVEPTLEQIGLQDSKCRWVAKWLKPGNAAKAYTGKNLQVYVDIHVPDNARPGTYTSKVDIDPDKGKATSFALILEVLPLKLSRPMPWGLFVYDVLSPESRADAEFFLSDLREMRRLGMTQCVMSPHASGRTPKVNSDGSVDCSLYDRLMDLYRETGFEDPPVLSMEGLMRSISDAIGKSDEFKFRDAEPGVKAREIPSDVRDFAKQVVRNIYDHAVKAKWLPFYVYYADEPMFDGLDGPRMENAKFMCAVTCDAAPGIRTAETLYSRDAWKALDNLVDLNIAAFGQLDHPCDDAAGNLAWRELAKKQQGKLYAIDFIGSFDYYMDGRSLTFPSEKGMLDGVMCWIQWIAWDMKERKEPFNPYMFLNNWFKGGPFCLREEDGRVWRSLAWIGIREGIDDSRYVQTLRKLIADAEMTGKDDAANRALKRLNEALSDVPWMPGVRAANSGWNPAEADKVRRELADAAVECRKSLGK